MSLLEQIIAEGNRTFPLGQRSMSMLSNTIACKDGTTLSVIAGWGCYCSPRPGEDAPDHYLGPYYAVEVGFPTVRPEPWSKWEGYAESPDVPTDTVYGCVPVALVRELVAAHGGES
jgi:hypothetical protein